MEVCPYNYLTAISSGINFSKVLVSFVMTDEFSMGVTKITSRISASWTHSLLFWFWPLFNSRKWQCYQKNLNQITLNHTTLSNLALPKLEVFVQISLNVNLSFNQTLLAFLFYVRQPWMTQLILARGYSLLIQKDSVTNMHGLAVYVKEGLPFVRDLYFYLLLGCTTANFGPLSRGQPHSPNINWVFRLILKQRPPGAL